MSIQELTRITFLVPLIAYLGGCAVTAASTEDAIPAAPPPVAPLPPPEPGPAPAVRLKQLIKEKKPEAVANLYAEHADRLANDAQSASLLKAAAKQLNQGYEKRFSSTLRKLRADNPASIAEAETLLQQYQQIPLLQQAGNRLRSADLLAARLDKAKAARAAAGAEAAKPERQFALLLRDKQYQEAARFWLAHRTEINSQSAQFAAGFRQMAEQISQPFAGRADTGARTLQPYTRGEILSDRMSQARNTLAQAETLRQELDNHPLLQEKQLRNKALLAFDATLERAKANIAGNEQANAGTERQLRGLLAAGKLDEAETLLASDGDFLHQAGKTAAGLQKSLVDALNRREEPSLQASLTGLRSYLKTDPAGSDWAQAKTQIEQAAATLAAYERHPLLRNAPARSRLADMLAGTVANMRRNFSDKADAAFLQFDPGGGRNFADVYPVPVDIAALLQRNLPRLEQHFQQASPERVKTFRDHYATSLDADGRRQLDSLYALARTPKDQNGKPTFAGAWRTLTAVRQEGLAVSSLPGFRPVFVQLREPGVSGQFAIDISNDTEFPLLTLSAAEAASHPELKHASHVVYLGPFSSRIERNVLANNGGVSRYKAGERQEENPEWQTAKDALDQAQIDDAETRRIIEQQIAQSKKATRLSNDPYGGILVSMAKDSVSSWSNGVADARRQLAATPRYKTVAVFRDYRFQDIVYEIRRQVSGSIALRDPVLGTTTEAAVNVGERRNFRKISGLHPADPNSHNLQAASDDDAIVDSYARQSHNLRLSQLVALLLNKSE